MGVAAQHMIGQSGRQMNHNLEHLAARAAPAIFVVLWSTGFIATKYVDRMRDGDSGAAQIKSMHEDARDDAVGNAGAVRPFRPCDPAKPRPGARPAVLR
jgi:hypothetical protein